MKKTLALLRNGFESASYKTAEFIAFCRTFKSEFSKELKSIGASDLDFRNGHFEIYGNYTLNGQPHYFMLSDVRFFGSEERIMYRTCDHYKDYTGGYNRYVQIEEGMGQEMNTSLFQVA